MLDPFLHLVVIGGLVQTKTSQWNESVVEPGWINDFLEIYVPQESTGLVTATAFFSEHDHKVSSPFFNFMVRVTEDGLADDFHIIPFGDAYQVHSFAYVTTENTTIFSSNPLEPMAAQFCLFLPAYRNVFGFRNLLFMRKNWVVSFQAVQVMYTKQDNIRGVTIDQAAQDYPDYGLNDSNYLSVEQCFQTAASACYVDRDTNELRILDPGSARVMYRAFNLTVQQALSHGRGFVVDESSEMFHYRIPLDLPTHTSSFAGLRRAALIPLLTTSSALVRDRIGWGTPDLRSLSAAATATRTLRTTLPAMLLSLRVAS